MKQTSRLNRYISIILAWSLAAVGLLPVVGAADPAVERVRRDLGYYRDASPMDSDKKELQGQIQELRQALERQEGRIRQLEDELKRLRSMAAKPPEPAKPPLQLAAPAKGKDEVSVCSQGCDFQDLQLAVNAASPGGTVTLAPEINGTCAVITKPLHLIGLRKKDGSRARLAGGACMDKAALVTNAPDILIEGLEISGIKVRDGNGACVRLDPATRDLVIRDVYCHDSQNGMLGKIAGRLLIEDSLFESNGYGNGQAHGIYIFGEELLIRRSQFLSSQNAGHTIKAGVERLTVEDSVLAALNGHNSRALDAFAGGTIVLRRNVLQQGPQSDNNEFIGIGLEPKRLLPFNHNLLMEDNWLICDRPNLGHGIVFSAQKLGPIEMRNNILVGLTGLGIHGVTDNGNRWYDSREEAGLPSYDGSLDSLPKPGKQLAAQAGTKK